MAIPFGTTDNQAYANRHYAEGIDGAVVGARTESPIAGALTSLRGQAETCFSRLNTLRSRLEPVLAAPGKAGEKAPVNALPAAGSSFIVVAVLEQRAMLLQLENEINELIARLEL